ncbi:receptor-type tyrosine-protein phosphatase kappa-like [Crassostrea virginica]
MISFERILYFIAVSLVIAYDDLSHNKDASQSHTYTGQGYSAENAVDRNTATCMRTEPIGGNNRYKTVWWKVDLGGVYNIYSVNILFRNYDGYEMRQRGRFAGFSLYISNTGDRASSSLCYKDGPELPPLNFTTTCTLSGRYVIFYNERIDGVTYPARYEVDSLVYTELCEVIVYGCNKDGVFGENCSRPCPGNCKTNTCHIQDGSCFECKPGWTGATCNTKCGYGSYGVDCKQNCPGKCKNNVTCDHLTGLCNGGCADGWNGSYCNKTCAVGLYGPDCKHQCSGHCRDSTVCNHVAGSCDAGCAAGWHGSLCDEQCDECSYGLECNQQTGKCKEGYTTDKDNTTKDGKTRNAKNETVNKSSDNHKNPKKINPRINTNVSVKNIKVHIAEMSADDNAGFKDEYSSIERGELYPCSEAKKPENNAKNRYTGMYPYDHSRVILKNSQDGNDYINANYIEARPKTKTITDFWTMVWQAEVSTIVCLTNLKEGNKNKCVQYWPNINDKLQAGDITVRHVGEKTYAEHSVRHFKIYHNTKTQNRDVMMYHYTAWADHGATDPLSLVVFHRQVMRATAQSTGKYTVVHCSAGIGRTGTYIALDVLYTEGERTGEVNIPMYVKTMRKDRINMVQTEDQYKVLYLALMEAFSGPSKTMTTEMFISQHQGQNNGDTIGDMTLSTEFETFLEKDCVISAQYPLPGYIEDFLRLVRDFNIQMVVFFGPIKDIKSGLGDLEITVLECPTWRDGQLTENKRILLDIIKEVKTEKNNQEGQILILSSDGATSCGAFCVVYNTLEQIKVDGEVDIFTIARQLQVRRPEFLSTWAEYQLCYAAVAEYLLKDFVYGN